MVSVHLLHLIVLFCTARARQGFSSTELRHRSGLSSYFRRMLKKVLSLELSSAGLSEIGAVGGAEVESMDRIELAVDGTGDAR